MKVLSVPFLHSAGIVMNWQTVFQCVQKISGLKRDSPHAIVLLRQEVVASSQLSSADKEELHLVLDGLQKTNLYGQISLVSIPIPADTERLHHVQKH